MIRAVLLLIMAVCCQPSAMAGNGKNIGKNALFVNKIYKKQIKKINQANSITCDLKSLRCDSLRWTGTMWEALCTITYKDACGTVKAKMELQLSQQGKNSAPRAYEDFWLTNADNDITRAQVKSIGLYMPRCIDDMRQTNSYNLQWLEIKGN